MVVGHVLLAGAGCCCCVSVPGSAYGHLVSRGGGGGPDGDQSELSIAGIVLSEVSLPVPGDQHVLGLEPPMPLLHTPHADEYWMSIGFIDQ